LTLGTITGGSGYVDGTYTAVAPTASPSGGLRALLTVVVLGGSVTEVTVAHAGLRYKAGDTLTVAASLIGGSGSGFSVPVASVGFAEVQAESATGGTIRLAKTGN